MEFNVIKMSLSDCWNSMHATCYFPTNTVCFIARVQALAAPTLTLVMELPPLSLTCQAKFGRAVRMIQGLT
jgi:hypothetical protein